MANRDSFSLLALLIFSALLASCASSPVNRDGAPRSGAATPRSLPGDAIPRSEPKSRYGNGPYYKVYGVTYKVLDSSHNYQERGVASWYGKKFHGRMTSSQEPYDMYAMTAAHKTLPLPTYVRVRNLKNNRSIVVRVNDRGPFIDNRLIDLSYSAAQKLDMIREGTTLVEVTAIGVDDVPTVVRNTTPTRPAPTVETDSSVFLQVGAFGDAGNAKRRFAMLQENGIGRAFIHEENSESATIYRVRIGPIADVDEYDALVARLQRMGIAETHLVAN